MLKYTGGGYGGFLPNIPARDLSDDEVEQYGGRDWLLNSNLYAPSGGAPSPEPSPESERPYGNIDLRDGVNNGEATLAGRALAHRKYDKEE